MHESAMKKFIELSDLVEAGKLPATACPRLAYFGHTFIHGIEQPEEAQCCECGYKTADRDEIMAIYDAFGDYDKHNKDDSLGWAFGFCPKCTVGRMFHIEDMHVAQWECVKCKFTWTSRDGTKCPSCDEVKNHWTSVDGTKCPSCGEVKNQ